ncbi:Nuclear protein localization protein 4 [Tyrophagus putrescentiae]|nr:Nuclear protein localization protein 4 [Tyrophagus putrescentiae]
MFSQVELDDVDKVLSKEDGLIEKPRDAKFCRHAGNSKCVHCTPYEPYDESYLKANNIKHMSFHSHLRKMKSGIDKGKFAILEDISCKIKSGCKGHAPWPKGICTKCQPSALTLNPQAYRHVDNVTFENTSIVENFLNYWRVSGHQRVGFLYGFYEVHKEVPLGIRAHVVAIFEPPQESTRDKVDLLLEHMNLKEVDSIANSLGYKRVGWIFTDLVPDEKTVGTVKHIRGADSFFLSAQECIMAGYFQNSHPNPCQLSPSGFFGSKFVTVCVTGDKENQVHMEAYQVSNQCMALVRDNCLIPTKDAPELAYVRESSKEQYVPDVFYKGKDKYGNNVTQIARPLPIEYLLLDVPVAANKESTYTFNPLPQLKPFPIENRMLEGHLQDFGALAQYMSQFDKDSQLLEAFSDLHLLVYLAHMDTLPLKEAMPLLLQAVKSKNRSLVNEWADSDKWATIEQLMKANNDFQSTSSANFNSGSSASRSSQPKWACNHCTFENDGNRSSCEMCSLPK